MEWKKISPFSLSDNEKQQIKDIIDSFNNEGLSSTFNFRQDSIRFGTWGELSRVSQGKVSVKDINAKLEPLNFKIVEDEDYDDDRGYLFSYKLYTNLSDGDKEGINKAEQEKEADSKYDAYKQYTAERWDKLAGFK